MIKRVGDWGKARQMVGNLDADIKKTNQIVMAQIAAQGERMVIELIRSQPGEWPSLDSKYLKAKVRRGLSEKTLIASSTYLQRMTSLATADFAFVGVKRNATDKSGKNSLADIGWILEHGSPKRNIKARPHFGPVHKELRRKMIQEQMFATYLMKHLRNRYGI